MSATGSHPWELAWKEGRWQELSPSLPAVTEFADYLKQQHTQRVLDLGCGAGRHSIFLAKQGFHVTGLDVSQTALGELDARSKTAGLANITLVNHEMQELPFIDGYFDAIVSTNVLHHGTGAEIRRTLAEVYRVMRSNGVSLIVTLSKNDFRYGNGTRLEQDTYRFTQGDEQGIVHHFFSKAELLEYFSQFEVLSLKEEIFPRSTSNALNTQAGDWAHFFLRLRKP